MSGCPGCNVSQQERQRLYETEYNKAVAYAKEIGKLVVIYETDEGVPKHMEAEAARTAGVRITRHIPFL